MGKVVVGRRVVHHVYRLIARQRGLQVQKYSVRDVSVDCRVANGTDCRVPVAVTRMHGVDRDA